MRLFKKIRDGKNRTIVGGNPACVIKYRDLDHYDKLVKDNRFYDFSKQFNV